MTIKINEDFKALIPPLQTEEKDLLEHSLLEEGCRDSIITWDNTIIDGHNRYEICTKHDIPYETEAMEFESENDAKEWMINNQFSRRNLPLYQRAVLALKLKPIYEERAKSQQGKRTDIPNNSWESEKKEELDKIRGNDNYNYDQKVKLIDNTKSHYNKQKSNQQKTNKNEIYIAKSGEQIKVGHSYDVENRIKQLKTASPDITLEFSIGGRRNVETQTHKRFSEHSLGGEWFKYSKETMDEMIKFIKREVNRGNETSAQLAEHAGVSSNTMSRVQKIEDHAPEEVKQKVSSGEFSINQAYNEVRKEEGKKELERKKEEYTARTEQAAEEEKPNKTDIFNTEQKYRIIYADPSWSYDDKQNTDRLGGAIKHYDTMTIQELSDLPVKDITEDNAVLFLWVTSPLLEESFDVINAWGFKYKTSFIWDKIKHNMGHYNSVRHEFLLIATKGSCTPDNKKLYDSVQSIERGSHSAKPKEFMDIIDDIYVYGDRLEMFAREQYKDNWYYWGNEV